MAKKTIETFDLNKNPPLPEDFGDQISADFLAKTPKAVIGHSTLKNKDIEIALEGEMTFPGEKPDASMTVDIAGYDKIVEALQTAAKTDPEAAQYFPMVLAVKGFGKTLPDGRVEWVINAKPDGSVAVNGAMAGQLRAEMGKADRVEGGDHAAPDEQKGGHQVPILGEERHGILSRGSARSRRYMRTASAGRSWPSRSEQRSLEMRSGSIGTTRSGK